MRHIKLFGCLAATLAFSLSAAASAQARKGEHGALKLQVTGRLAKLTASDGYAITSHSSSGSAEFTSATTGTAEFSLQGSEIEGYGERCTSAGQQTGTIKTDPLTVETGWIDKSTGEVGIDLKPASGSYLYEFDCEGGIIVNVKGSLIGRASPINEVVLEEALAFEAGAAYKNSPESFEGAPEDVLTSEISGAIGAGEFATAQEQPKVTLLDRGTCKVKKGQESCKPGQFEVNTLANPARPEVGRCDKQKGGRYSDPNCTTSAASKGKYEFVPIPG